MASQLAELRKNNKDLAQQVTTLETTNGNISRSSAKRIKELEKSNNILIQNFNKGEADLKQAYNGVGAEHNAEIDVGLAEISLLQHETVPGQVDVTGMKLSEDTKVIVTQIVKKLRSLNNQLGLQKNQLLELKLTKERLARQESQISELQGKVNLANSEKNEI